MKKSHIKLESFHKKMKKSHAKKKKEYLKYEAPISPEDYNKMMKKEK